MAILDRFRAGRHTRADPPASGTATAAQNITTADSITTTGPTHSADSNSPGTSVDGPLRDRDKPSRFQEASDLEAGRTANRNEKLEDGDVLGWEDPYGPAPGFKKWVKLYWHDVLG